MIEVTRYIMEIIKDVLSATLKLESEEVSAILFEQLIEQRKETLQNYLHEKEFLRGTVAEMVSEYIQRRKKVVEGLVEAAAMHRFISQTPGECRRRLTAALLAAPREKNVIFGDFLHNLLTGLCQDKYIAGVVVHMILDKLKVTEILLMLDNPSNLLKLMVDCMAELQSMVAATVVEFYHAANVQRASAGMPPLEGVPTRPPAA
jgi:hypothetical protein